MIFLVLLFVSQQSIIISYFIIITNPLHTGTFPPNFVVFDIWPYIILIYIYITKYLILLSFFLFLLKNNEGNTKHTPVNYTGSPEGFEDFSLQFSIRYIYSSANWIFIEGNNRKNPQLTEELVQNKPSNHQSNQDYLLFISS